MKHNFLYSCLIFFVFSCTPNADKSIEQFTYADFPSRIQLSGENLTLKEQPLNPIRIFFSDSILFVQNARSEVHFSLYNMRNQTKITDCFLFGNGPHEMIAPAIISCEEGVVHILDKPKMTLYSYEIASLCNNDFQCFNKTHFNGFPFDMALLKNKIAALVYAPNHQRITFYSMTGDSIETKGEFPTRKKMELVEQFETYQCYITTDKDNFYLFYKFTDLIEIYDQDGILLRSIQGPDFFLTELKQVGIENGAMKATSTSEDVYGAYFFPLNVDGKIFTLYAGKGNNTNNPGTLLNQILVFDSLGNPLITYDLDIPIFTMTIDPIERIIYGITMNPEPELVKYQL